jgi:putative transposase
MNLVLKSYKYCLLPTYEQKDWFDGLFNACIFVYNLALEVKKNAWSSAAKNISSYDLMKQLTELKHTDCKWLKDYPCKTLEASIANLDKAYQGFFRGGGFPKFKNKFDRTSAFFRKSIKVKDAKIRVAKIGWIEFIEHRPLPKGEIKNCVISKTNTNKYFVSILIQDGEDAPVKPEVRPESAVGIDMGLKTFATFSDGQKIDNPKFLSHELARLRIEHRKLSRRFKKGAKEQSKGWHKQKMVVAKLQEKIANKREDFLHKTSHSIVKQNNTICVETLNVIGMMKNRNLSSAIGDVSWASFINMLKYKAEWYGKNLIEIGQFEPSTKTCSSCGFVNKALTLADREWDCEICQAHHDRDENAAKNIKIIGLQTKPPTANVGTNVKRIGCKSNVAKGIINKQKNYDQEH